LPARERLRLACYYVQALTLAETGRLLKEHEATVSRRLGRTRGAIRRDVERQLRAEGLTSDQIAACFASVVEDPTEVSRLATLGVSPWADLVERTNWVRIRAYSLTGREVVHPAR
jgi:hypothetical protein